MMVRVDYEALRPREFLERLREAPVAYLPLGTLEWHGLHLPLGSDGLQARGALRMIAARAGGIVLPPLFLGPDRAETRDGALYCGMDIFSFEEGCAQRLPGSAYYMEDERFAQMLDCTMRNLARAGFRAVVAHGHGPSTSFFAARAVDYRARYGLECRTLFELGFEGADGLMTDHAAANETSLMLALHPELVDMSALSADEIPIASWGEDPRSGASEARGRALLENNVRSAVERLRAILQGVEAVEARIDRRNVRNLLRENDEAQP